MDSPASHDSVSYHGACINVDSALNCLYLVPTVVSSMCLQRFLRRFSTLSSVAASSTTTSSTAGSSTTSSRVSSTAASTLISIAGSSVTTFSKTGSSTVSSTASSTTSSFPRRLVPHGDFYSCSRRFLRRLLLFFGGWILRAISTVVFSVGFFSSWFLAKFLRHLIRQFLRQSS